MTHVIANKQQPHGPIEEVVHATKNFIEEWLFSNLKFLARRQGINCPNT